MVMNVLLVSVISRVLQLNFYEFPVIYVIY